MLHDFYERPALLFGTVFLGFLALSMIVAVGPAIDMQEKYQPLPGSKPFTASEERGLQIFVAEGCPVCHTQQVRPLPMDAVWGRPTVGADFARLGPLSWYQGTPGLLGSERTGPDLSNVGKRQASEAWQLIHLYNPRAQALIPSGLATNLWALRCFSTGVAQHDGEGGPVPKDTPSLSPSSARALLRRHPYSRGSASTSAAPRLAIPSPRHKRSPRFCIVCGSP